MKRLEAQAAQLRADNNLPWEELYLSKYETRFPDVPNIDSIGNIMNTPLPTISNNSSSNSNTINIPMTFNGSVDNNTVNDLNNVRNQLLNDMNEALFKGRSS